MDFDKAVPEYIYYVLTQQEITEYLQSIAEQSVSAYPSIKPSDIENLEFLLPDRKTQEKIVSILRSIDEKIVQNNKINNNLEQQAEALFHSLFVEDVNPIWKEGVLSDLGTVVAGGTPSKTKPEYYSRKGIAWITPKDLSLNKSKFISHGEIDISELGFSKSSAIKMPTGTVLFSSRAPIGYIAIAANEVTTNQGFKSVVPNENVGTAFMYYLLRFLLPTIEGMASGSTFKEISGAGMKSVPVVIPDNETIDKFNAFCTPIFQQQEVLEAENSRLVDIRDALLPKLMAGDLDVSGIEL
ncbi:MAG: restriction endonuclease subunit S [Veillonella parvula]